MPKRRHENQWHAPTSVTKKQLLHQQQKQGVKQFTNRQDGNQDKERKTARGRYVQSILRNCSENYRAPVFKARGEKTRCFGDASSGLEIAGGVLDAKVKGRRGNIVDRLRCAGVGLAALDEIKMGDGQFEFVGLRRAYSPDCSACGDLHWGMGDRRPSPMGISGVEIASGTEPRRDLNGARGEGSRGLRGPAFGSLGREWGVWVNDPLDPTEAMVSLRCRTGTRTIGSEVSSSLHSLSASKASSLMHGA